MRVPLPLALGLALALGAPASIGLAQDVPRAEQTRETTEPDPPVYETWWFWVAVIAAISGVTLAVIVDVTTDDPAPSTAGLTLRF